jgi:multiple sugar transport system substrate-binding protein
VNSHTAVRWKQMGVGTLVLLFVGLGVYLFQTLPDTGKGEGVTLTLTVPAGHATDSVYRKLIAEYERTHPGVRVRLITVSGANYYRKVMVMIVGGTSPDLMWMGQSFSEFADKGVFLDLGSRIREAGISLDDYKPEVLGWYRRGDKIYSLPFGVDLSFLIYNRKLFREAGLPFPQDDWTFDEFLHAAKTLWLPGTVGNRNLRGRCP